MPAVPHLAHARSRQLALLLLALGSHCAGAAVFTVGSDLACTHTSIQAAIDAAAADGEPSNVIIIARNQNYTAQALHVVGQNLTLRGAASSCTSQSPAGTPTTISGDGNGGLPVLDLDLRGATRSLIVLNDLELTGADAGAGDGGALRVRGNAQVNLNGMTLRDSNATRGGGVYVTGDGATATASLLFEASSLGPSLLEGNGATDGGAIYCDDFSFVALNTARVAGNNATRGGGAFAHGACQLLLRSGGAPGGIELGIRGNTASLDGGGVYAEGGAEPASSGPSAGQSSPEISGNSAGRDGGGAYLIGSGTFMLAEDLQLRDNSAGTTTAGRGGGLFITGTASAFLTEENPAVLCGADAPCVDLSGNHAGTNGHAGKGGAAYVTAGGSLSLGFVRIANNNSSDASAILVTGNASQATATTALITGNNGAPDTFVVQSGGKLTLVGATLADDASTASIASVSNASLELRTDILFDPGKTVLALDGSNTITTQCVLSHVDFDQAGDVRVGDPLFVDAAGGNYRLGPGSPAVDACGSIPFPPGATDFTEAPRGVDLPEAVNLGGAFDLGAYERQFQFEIFASSFEQ